MQKRSKPNSGEVRPHLSQWQVAFLYLLFPIFLGSCERDIEISLIEETPKLVIEATIENDQPPLVFLSRSLNYYATLSPQSLVASFVQGASVFISNGSRTHRLKEYTQPIGAGLNLIYYSTDSTNLSTAITGKVKTSYSLRVVVDGEEYTATTTIPDITRRIDSLWWKPAPPPADANQVLVMVRATDPPGYGDYIRYFTRQNNQPFFAPRNATFDDLFVDGTTYELPLEKGLDRNVTTADRDRFFYRGDTVTLKLSNIDKATFDFWRTMEYSYASVGNPFSSPIKVQSNIKGNALGYFGGYASQYRTLIIPK